MTLDRHAAEELLAAILRGQPKLDGAACIGHAALFDPPADREPFADVEHRHTQALALCHSCPCRDECRAWRDSQPSAARSAVVGGMAAVAQRGQPRSRGGPSGGRAA